MGDIPSCYGESLGDGDSMPLRFRISRTLFLQEWNDPTAGVHKWRKGEGSRGRSHFLFSVSISSCEYEHACREASGTLPAARWRPLPKKSMGITMQYLQGGEEAMAAGHEVSCSMPNEHRCLSRRDVYCWYSFAARKGSSREYINCMPVDGPGERFH